MSKYRPECFCPIIEKILHTIYQKLVEYLQEIVSIKEKLLDVSHRLMRRFRSSSSISLTNVKETLCTSSSPVMFETLFNTCQAKTRDDCERLKAVHSGSRSHSTNGQSYSKSRHALATGNVPSQQSTTSPPESLNFNMMSIIHNMIFCSGHSDALAPDALKLDRKTRSYCGRRGMFAICFIHLECVDFISLCAS